TRSSPAVLTSPSCIDCNSDNAEGSPLATIAAIAVALASPSPRARSWIVSGVTAPPACVATTNTASVASQRNAMPKRSINVSKCSDICHPGRKQATCFAVGSVVQQVPRLRLGMTNRTGCNGLFLLRLVLLLIVAGDERAPRLRLDRA